MTLLWSFQVICNIANYITHLLSPAIVVDLPMICSAASARHVCCDIVHCITSHHVAVNHSHKSFCRSVVSPFCHFIVLLFRYSADFCLTSIQFPSNIYHHFVQYPSLFHSKSVAVTFKVRRHSSIQFYASIRWFTIFFKPYIVLDLCS